jgi:lysophospholipase L1-like esterase
MGIEKVSYWITAIVYLILLNLSTVSGQATIKIMPLGNSITQGITDGSLPTDQLRGYRYGLRYLLKNKGYKVDFVGSQSDGCAFFSDCQHAGIGGSRDQYVLRLLTDGYDERWGVQIIVPPGPYLDVYNPDIILLEIGTNDIIHEGYAAITDQKVSDILDMIDQYENRANKEVIVFLALILNRVKPWLPGSAAAQTTAFNNAIKTMALARIAAGDKLVIVDMENDAGFVYDGTDMSADGIHPNELGYSKMAALWNSSINANYNTAPVIAGIPDQVFAEGNNSSVISLDNYVSDIEDSDSQLTWSTAQLGSSNLNITLNANRQVVASPVDPGWYGSQTVVFTVTDRGNNGKYIKSDKDTVVFTITPVNNAPVITSTPALEVSVGSLYSYTLISTDDNNVITLSAVTIPSWLTFSGTSGILSGIPQAANHGQNHIVLRASDGSLKTDQDFFISVNLLDAVDNPKAGVLTMYPVPAQDYLMVGFGNLTSKTLLEVINSIGMVVQKNYMQANQNNYRLDLGKFENGIYYLHLVDKSVEYFGKFSVTK